MTGGVLGWQQRLSIAVAVGCIPVVIARLYGGPDQRTGRNANRGENGETKTWTGVRLGYSHNVNDRTPCRNPSLLVLNWY